MNREHLLKSLEAAETPPEILAAFAAVPRERFVPPEFSAQAYADSALPLSCGSTISQPAMVAIVLRELRLEPGIQVLEVGSGSGYFLALLQALGCEATGVEIDPVLASRSASALETLRSDTLSPAGREALVPVSGAPWAEVVLGDAATANLHGPFDRVIFSASLEKVPGWALELLAPDGFVLAPIGTVTQELERVYSDGRRERTGRLCRFVPFQET